MKATQPGITPGQRHRHSGAQILGKLRVVRGGVGPAMLQAVAARRHAQRTFGGDMHIVRPKRLQFSIKQLGWAPGQTNFRIRWAGETAEHARLNDAHFMTLRNQHGARGIERAHHAIGLRMPGIRDDANSHDVAALRGVIHQQRRRTARHPD